MGLRIRGRDRRAFGLMGLGNEWRGLKGGGGRMDAICGRLCAVGNEI